MSTACLTGLPARPVLSKLSDLRIWAFALAGLFHGLILTTLVNPLPPPVRARPHTLEVQLAVMPSAPPVAAVAAPVQPQAVARPEAPDPAPPPVVRPVRPVRQVRPEPVAAVRHPAEKPAPKKPAPALMPLPAPVAPAPVKRLDAGLLGQQIAELSEAFNRGNLNRVAARKATAIESLSVPKYKTAAYEQAWQSKVERVGNLNYPEVARKNRLSGTLKLSVSLRADGSIETINIRQSSGHPELDEAAARIVRLAAPYARFPDEFRAQTDLLVITRTWRFLDDFRLQAIP